MSFSLYHNSLTGAIEIALGDGLVPLPLPPAALIHAVSTTTDRPSMDEIDLKPIRGLISLLNGTRPCQDDFLSIAAHLRELRYPPDWSDSPKLFYILIKLGQSVVFHRIFNAGFTDTWLPFPTRTLRRLLDRDHVESFKSLQELCLDDVSSGLEGRQHLSLFDISEVGLVEEKFLGAGGFGEVHAVRHGQTGELYAMKTLSRPGVHRDHVNWVKSFEREIRGMQRVRHLHCVELIASITDLESCVLISSPVADMDLAQYMENDLSASQPGVLKRAIGCITSALVYLHSVHIRHDDLKPNNVLVHGDRVLLTDFGFSLDSSESGISTTYGMPGHMVKKYSAPEVFDHASRSRLTDVWGLGCILFEILTRLSGQKPSAMKAFWLSQGTRRDSYADNAEATELWFKRLMQTSHQIDPTQHTCNDILLSFVYQLMLEPDRLSRPSAAQSFDRIKDIDYESAKESKKSWIGPCCAHQTAYSPQSMRRSSEHSTNRSFKLVMWPILDFQYLHKDMAYLYLDLNRRILYYGPTLSSMRDQFLFRNPQENQSLSMKQIIWPGTSLEIFNQNFSKLVKASGRQMQSYSPESQILRPSVMSRSLFTARTSQTTSLTFNIGLQALTDHCRPAHYNVQLSLCTTCFSREASYGTPFIVFVANLNGASYSAYS